MLLHCMLQTFSIGLRMYNHRNICVCSLIYRKESLLMCLIGCYFVVWLWKKHFQLIQCLEYWVDCRPFERHFWIYGIAIRPLKAKAMNAFKKFMVILNSVICFDRKRGGTKKVNPDLAPLLWGSVCPRLGSSSSHSRETKRYLTAQMPSKND